MTHVKIKWGAPRTVAEALNLDQEDDKGLYQIYGRHILFGPGTLFYIGKTVDTFSQRISNHQSAGWFRPDDDENDLEIRIGRIVNIDGSDNSSDWQNWDRVLSRVEALQIYWHSPPYNSQNISTRPGRRLSIENTGYRGQLDAKFPSEQEIDPPSNGPIRLAVTIKIECNYSSMTLVHVIEKIGIELVKEIQDEHDIRPKLISDSEPPYRSYRVDPYYVNTTNTTAVKKRYLDAIAEHLSIQLEARLVPTN
jgi:hypothetical protein